MSQAASVATCQQVLEGVGSGVAASLRAVDCAAQATAQAAFGRLFGADGALLRALTILLTLYVGFFAFSLITGRSRLGISALTPRMITLGLVHFRDELDRLPGRGLEPRGRRARPDRR